MSKKWVVMSQVALGSMLLATGYLVLQRRASRRVEHAVARVHVKEEVPLQLDLEDLDDAFDVAPESGVEPTVLSAERVPAPMSAEDGEAPGPEELGERWLAQATSTESISADPDYPNIEELAAPESDLGAASSDDDETTRDYIRKHRISSVG